MDAAEEVPQRVGSECVDLDGEAQQHSPTSTVDAYSVSKVLGDDNLLGEILLRTGFPTTLVCAALVCKRWLQHASDRVFLNHFRKRHPSRLLGLYFVDRENRCVAARFFPMLAQPPELSTIIRHANFSLESYWSPPTNFLGCRNGSVLINFYDFTHAEFIVGVHSPLCPERGLVVAPPSPDIQIQDGYFCNMNDDFSVEEADSLSYLNLIQESNKEGTNFMLHAHMLRYGNDGWCAHLTLATYQHQLPVLGWVPNAVLIDNKIYMPSFPSSLVVLDLMASSISTIQLPQGVEFGNRDTVLARADDASAVYLIHTKKFQLCIWLHKGYNWSLLDTICLHEMCANLMMPDCMVKDEDTSLLWINHVGDNAESVLLQMGRCEFYLDIKCRTLVKVHEMTERDSRLCDIHPFMMIWPPTFPALKDDLTRNAT